MRTWLAMVIIAGMLLACSDGDESGGDGAAPAGSGGTASIKIISPMDNSKVSAGTVAVQYEVRPSPSGDHIHMYVDDRKPDVLRRLKGTYDVEDLSPGEHTITIKEANAGHTPTGHEASVHIVAE